MCLVPTLPSGPSQGTGAGPRARIQTVGRAPTAAPGVGPPGGPSRLYDQTMVSKPAPAGRSPGVRGVGEVVLYPPYLRRTLTIALVVGLIISLVNQGDVILAGNASAETWLKTGLNFLIPFVVSNLGLLAGHPVARAGRTESGH